MRYTKATAITALASLPTSLATPVHKRQYDAAMVYDFAKLTPSADLNWTPCFDSFTCTLLTVPLDYKDEAVGTTNIGFIKWTTNSTSLNANTTAQDILVNPGGPGGSGVSFLIEAFPYFLKAFGTDNNLVGFDPRGVNNSGPDLSCFPGQHNTRLLYDPRLGEPVDVNDTNSLSQTWARAGAFGEWCSNVHSSGNSSAKYANTVATASDMLHYTELLAASKGQDTSTSQLWYYGASYGTVLGTTYASLFPDRVGRIIVDGVVDGEDYYKGKWEANLPDADKAVESFFTYCYAAGESECDFWADSANAIKARYDAVIDKLKERPIIVTDPNDVEYPAIVTYTDYLSVLVEVPYSPSVYFPILARVLAQLEVGDASLLASFAGDGVRKDTCNPNATVLNSQIEPLQFISCNDANGRFNLSDYDAWVEHADFLANESHYLGEAWAAGIGVNCRSLNIRAPESQVFTGIPHADSTSNPLLFLSNTIDPVTPLRAAQKMQKQFGGAGLLVQDAVGHSTEAALSNCTFGYMKQYFKDASLPAEGTVCQADQVPFKNSTSTSTSIGTKVLRKRFTF